MFQWNVDVFERMFHNAAVRYDPVLCSHPLTMIIKAPEMFTFIFIRFSFALQLVSECIQTQK